MNYKSLVLIEVRFIIAEYQRNREREKHKIIWKQPFYWPRPRQRQQCYRLISCFDKIISRRNVMMHVKETMAKLDSVKIFVERVVTAAPEKITTGVTDQRKMATVPLVQLVQFIKLFIHVLFHWVPKMLRNHGQHMSKIIPRLVFELMILISIWLVSVSNGRALPLSANPGKRLQKFFSKFKFSGSWAKPIFSIRGKCTKVLVCHVMGVVT